MMHLKDINIGMFEHRLLLAFVLGTIIGLERQWQHKIAGIKTNALVAGGAALFILVAQKVGGDSSGAARVAANIVTGIGFLGAGVMMRNGSNITGINTAATIWCSSAIGALAGLGFWYESLIGTAFIVTGNILLRPIGNRIDNRITQIKESGNIYLLKISVKQFSSIEIKQALIDAIKNESTLHISTLKTDVNNLIIAEIHSLDRRQTDIENVVTTLSTKTEITQIGWEEVKV
ncbi:MAG: MgtC/SapB family protein [Bacteroidia bacterium]|nr:MgtC/SapB family protein [Bacteroidia bacterium]MBP9690336.1 MgtC/SapB family protein [Bacteroidia bacterium]